MSDGALRDIICLSTHYWDDAWFRKQHFMARFGALGHRVLYVEPSHSIVRGRPSKSGSSSNPVLGFHCRTAGPGIVTLAPRRLLPAPQNRASALVSRNLTLRQVWSAGRGMGVRQPLVWIYDPTFVPALCHHVHGPVVFDLVDDLEGYPWPAAYGRFVGRCVDSLARSADRTVVTSPVLQRQLGAARETAVIPNGYESSLFDPGVPPMAGLRRGSPVAGFIGTLFSFLDYALIERVVREMRDVDFVFAGRIEASAEPLFRPLLSYQNVRWLGVLPQESVPGVIASFDVCLSPFAPGRVTASVSPLKVYEYLAMLKPAVATPSQGMREDALAQWIRFAEPDDFAAAIRTCLVGTRDVQGLRAAVERCTWDARFTAVREFVGDLLLAGD